MPMGCFSKGICFEEERFVATQFVNEFASFEFSM
jgi:hypothetical protein